MAKCGILLLAIFLVGGFAFPAEDAVGFDEDMSVYFDHTMRDVEGRIVGGTVAADGAYPWMVAITTSSQRHLLCGGSVVTNRHVLTAAHCNVAAAPGGVLTSTLRIIVGTNRWERGGSSYRLSSHLNHPQYNPAAIKNDIGVLRTSSNIASTTRIRIIPINYDFVGGGIPVRVSGWGNTFTGGFPSDRLMELRLTTVDGPRCISEVARVGQQINMRPPHVDPNIELCTFLASGRGTCNGDSGSALVRNSNNQQVGIVSWGLPCARGAPDMFVRVSAYRTWLTTALR